MGKVDDMRAMREARYAAMKKTTGQQITDEINADPNEVAKLRRARTQVREGKLTFDADLCGHRSIGGKTCTRSKDHTEKNHRYS